MQTRVWIGSVLLGLALVAAPSASFGVADVASANVCSPHPEALEAYVECTENKVECYASLVTEGEPRVCTA